MKSNATRFWEKVDTAGDCWNWTASKTPAGYGRFKIDGKMKRAHRVAYEMLVGEIPEGLVIDHLCRNTSCVRPDHLEPVTNAENIRRGDTGKNNAIKTHCKHGHPFDEVNTYITSDGWRQCRACHREGERTRRESRVAA